MERIQDFFDDPNLLPTLNGANGSSRQQRSERREACTKVLIAILSHTDLASLRVGIPTPKGFMNYTVAYIAKVTGMCQKRVERALRDLKAAGLITVSQPRKLSEDGQWIGLAAVKAVSKHLFGVVNLARMLVRERKKASKRHKKKTQEWANKPLTLAEKARKSLCLQSLGDLFKKFDAPTPQKDKTPKPSTDPPGLLQAQRQLWAEMIQIQEAHKDWTIKQCREEVRKRLKKPL